MNPLINLYVSCFARAYKLAGTNTHFDSLFQNHCWGNRALELGEVEQGSANRLSGLLSHFLNDRDEPEQAPQDVLLRYPNKRKKLLPQEILNWVNQRAALPVASPCPLPGVSEYPKRILRYYAPQTR